MKLFIYIALTALAACLLSQILKTLFNYVARKDKFELKNLVADGNYPSSHTSLTTSVTAISWINVIYKWVTVGDAEIQMWCAAAITVLWLVVIRDALGVRYTVQKLCEAVTKLASDSKNSEEIKKILDVKSGHKPHEVIAGAILGMIVATISSLIYYGLYAYTPIVFVVFVIYILVSMVIVRKKN